MPSKSLKQARTMAACAHGAKLKVCTGMPKSVAREFNAADKRTGILKRGYRKMGKS